MQQVLGYSALKTGLTFLATAGTVVAVAGISQALVTRFGPRPVMAVGLALITGGMVSYTQIPIDGWPQQAGLASGLINSSQQIGGALGVAIAATVAFTHTKTLLVSGDAPAQAATSGFAPGFWVIAGLSAVAFVACLVLVRGTEVTPQAAAVPA